MDQFCRRITLALALTLQLLISVDNENMMSLVTRAGYSIRNSAAAASSPLAGTKIRTPWVNHSSSGVQPAYQFIPSPYDVFKVGNLTKLLDVGACSSTDKTNTFSYVPPLDGTNPGSDNTLCQEFYGMRFVLFDLKLVNIDTVDSLSGSFTAQFQLVFHWVEGWETNPNDTDWFVYGGDPISTADGASTCGFDCDTTAAVKTQCCDRMWVPPLQVPSCKVNDVQSVTPLPYLTITYLKKVPSYWERESAEDYTQHAARRTWYVGLDVTCPFTPDFRNFPFDYQFLTVDIINPYASRTWLQLNKGFLEANIIDSISGIDLSPDHKIDGWSIKDLIVSSACGTQQTWKPTFLTQDHLLGILGDDYKSQNETISDNLKINNLKCAEMKNLISKQDISLSIPTNKLLYNDTKNDYMQRLDTTIAKYKNCTSSKRKEFKWIDPKTPDKMLDEDVNFKLNDSANVNRSFSFLDLEYLVEPIDGINFECLIDAVANLTTPGIRINIIIQRFARYYIVKLFLPTCACVAFSFTAFALDVNELFNRLTVIVPSAIALSALQGFVVATDVPAVAYVAPTTYIILLSYGIQLLIALESICLKFWPRTCLFRNQGSIRQSNKPHPLSKGNAIADALDTRAGDTQHSCKTNENGMEAQSHRNDHPIEGIQMIDMDRSQQNDPATQEGSLEEEKEQSRLSGAREEEKQQSKLSEARKIYLRIIDLICCGSLVGIYILLLAILIAIPWQNASIQKKKNLPSTYESLWN